MEGKYTFLDLAAEVLQREKRPLSARQIWDAAVELGLDKKYGSSGKTPWQTLAARLGDDVRKHPETTRFLRASERPALFSLKEPVEAIEEPKSPAGKQTEPDSASAVSLPDVLLLPTFSEAEEAKKRLATEGPKRLFGVTVSTFSAWVEDLWGLYGDGRALVSEATRYAFMQVALEREAKYLANRHAVSDFPAFGQGVPSNALLTPGTVPFACKIVRAGAGLVPFENAIGQARNSRFAALPSNDGVSLSGLERAILRYFDLLEEHGQIERGTALRILADSADQPFARSTTVRMESTAPLTWQQEAFFKACDNVRFVRPEVPNDVVISRAPKGVRVRFAFATGPSATTALLHDLLSEELGNGTAVIACKSPLSLYRAMVGRLKQEGIICACADSLPFSTTMLGRAFFSAYRVLHDEEWDAADLTDVLASPFTGVSAKIVRKFNKEIRSDRLAKRGDWVHRAAKESKIADALFCCASNPCDDDAVSILKKRAGTLANEPDLFGHAQMAAVDCLASTMNVVRALGGSADSVERVVKNLAIPISVSSDAGEPRVQIMSVADASHLPAHSCDLLIISDMTEDNYPVADKEDAASLFFSRIGLKPMEAAASRARRTFIALERLPRHALVLERSENNEKAEPAYPSVVWQEFVDAYREDPTREDDIDKTFGLPESLREGLTERGEEFLTANVAVRQRDEKAEPICGVDTLHDDEIEPQRKKDVLLAKSGRDGKATNRPCMFPSRMETYLQCPKMWFLSECINPGQLDEQFGPREKGSFRHQALQEFYEAFKEKLGWSGHGYPKVSASNLEEARAVMSGVLDSLAARQAQRKPSSGRLVAVSELEAREVEQLKAELLSFLDFEAQLLPAFHPLYLELDMENGVEYAGALLKGRSDRIDIDDAGHAVVVDYKGALDDSYDIAGKTWESPGKVQARIYAQVVRRTLGLDVVGALYVSYKRGHAVAGALDPRFLGPVDFGGGKLDKLLCAAGAPSGDWVVAAGPRERGQGCRGADFASLPFEDMLDATEQRVAAAVSDMTAGIVAPCPADKEACTYCIAVNCERRLS